MRDELIGVLVMAVYFSVVGGLFFLAVHAMVTMLEFVAAMGT